MHITNTILYFDYLLCRTCLVYRIPQSGKTLCRQGSVVSLKRHLEGLWYFFLFIFHLILLAQFHSTKQIKCIYRTYKFAKQTILYRHKICSFSSFVHYKIYHGLEVFNVYCVPSTKLMPGEKQRALISTKVRSKQRKPVVECYYYTL